MKKKRDSEGIVPISILKREFICPNCGQETTVTTSMEHVLWNVVTCQKCNKTFLIENDKLKKRPA